MNESLRLGSLSAGQPREWTDRVSIGTRMVRSLRALQLGQALGDDAHLTEQEQKFLERAEIRDSVALTARLYSAGEASCSELAPEIGYKEGVDRGDYGQLDAKLAAVPAPSVAATADPAFILPQDELFRVSSSIIVKPRSEWEPWSELNRHRIHLGVKRATTQCC